MGYIEAIEIIKLMPDCYVGWKEAKALAIESMRYEAEAELLMDDDLRLKNE